MVIPWRDDMAIDGGPIDRDHREQHDLVRRFVNLPGDDIWRDDALALLATLRRVSDRHFAYEEAALAKFRHATLAQHKAQHRRLLEILDDIAAQVETASPSSPFPFAYVKAKADELLQFWFLDHLAKADVPLRALITGRVSRS